MATKYPRAKRNVHYVRPASAHVTAGETVPAVITGIVSGTTVNLRLGHYGTAASVPARTTPSAHETNVWFPA
jgi:hypothetical protein